MVSPHRMKRPWQGQVEAVSMSAAAVYEPGCYLCPGNKRQGGAGLRSIGERTFLKTTFRRCIRRLRRVRWQRAGYCWRRQRQGDAEWCVFLRTTV